MFQTPEKIYDYGTSYLWVCSVWIHMKSTAQHVLSLFGFKWYSVLCDLLHSATDLAVLELLAQFALQLPLGEDKNTAKNLQKTCLHLRAGKYAPAFESLNAYFSFLVKHSALLFQKFIISLSSNNHTPSTALHYKHWTYRKFNCTLALKPSPPYMRSNIFIYFSLL